MNRKEHDELVANIFEERKEELEYLEEKFKKYYEEVLLKNPNIVSCFITSPQYFDRMGQEISMAKWCILNELPEIYKIIKQEDVGSYWVSTVWLGMNTSYWKNLEPLIFETMIFAREEYKEKELELDLWMERYGTEEEAIAGHAKAVELARIGKLEEDE